MKIDPADLRFTQDSVAAHFKEPHSDFSLQEALRRITTHEMSPDEFPMVRVISYGGCLWSIDNRRLWVFRQARCPQIAVRLVNRMHPRLQDVLNTPRMYSKMSKVDFFPRVRRPKHVNDNYSFLSTNTTMWQPSSQVVKSKPSVSPPSLQVGISNPPTTSTKLLEPAIVPPEDRIPSIDTPIVPIMIHCGSSFPPSLPEFPRVAIQSCEVGSDGPTLKKASPSFSTMVSSQKYDLSLLKYDLAPLAATFPQKYDLVSGAPPRQKQPSPLRSDHALTDPSQTPLSYRHPLARPPQTSPSPLKSDHALTPPLQMSPSLLRYDPALSTPPQRLPPTIQISRVEQSTSAPRSMFESIKSLFFGCFGSCG